MLRGALRKPWSGVALAVLGAVTASCGARSGLLENPDAGAQTSMDSGATRTCGSAPMRCVAHGDNACEAPHFVDPVCDAASLVWHCADAAWAYQSTPNRPASCLPIHDPDGPIASLGGSLARVPTDDGRCLWIAEDVSLKSGASLHNVAFNPDFAAPFGTCPAKASYWGGTPSASVGFADGTDDPTLHVQITGAYRMRGTTRVSYRLFRIDPNAVFGLTELGTGLGYWDKNAGVIEVYGPKQLRFTTDLDFGNASFEDDTYGYLWGCNAPGHYLTEGCLLARLDMQDQLQLFEADGQWRANAPAGAGSIVFDDGPWISSVTRDALSAGSLLHVFAAGFGDNLQLQHAPQPQGPWSSASSLLPCALPAFDAQSYCAGPIVHEELADPARPDELVVSYGVATTGPLGAGTPEDYWSRLAWVAR